ncbi:hypothetical protein EMCRGX_G000046 [Ephydatia muelleri]
MALADDGLAPQTIKSYLSAVQSMQLSLRLPPPRDQSSLPILKRVLDGLIRDKSLGELDTAASPDSMVYWAIATTAFFGFFRLGELLVEAETLYNSALHLSWGDVAINDQAAATMVKFHLRRSKCDQFGTGADVLLRRSGCQLCPVAAILAYIKARADTQGAFFVDNNKVPITKSKFVAKVRDALKAAGYPEDQFAGHSIHIGAATTAALAGIEDSTIQTLGRWHSAAFLRYICTPHDHLAAITASLARSNPQ